MKFLIIVGKTKFKIGNVIASNLKSKFYSLDLQTGYFFKKSGSF